MCADVPLAEVTLAGRSTVTLKGVHGVGEFSSPSVKAAGEMETGEDSCGQSHGLELPCLD